MYKFYKEELSNTYTIKSKSGEDLVDWIYCKGCRIKIKKKASKASSSSHANRKKFEKFQNEKIDIEKTLCHETVICICSKPLKQHNFITEISKKNSQHHSHHPS